MTAVDAVNVGDGEQARGFIGRWFVVQVRSCWFNPTRGCVNSMENKCEAYVNMAVII